ncbi:L,D-transpeptidase [Kitasatospora sp. LaBMicrA B282]|uniref:L,D-transpeptidase n=1 Tax=Kitasatospora sp. LaBMicrA B282 TaxID=3420949 RepID=UPI003D0DDD07
MAIKGPAIAVAGLTLSALAVVTLLAVQAEGTAGKALAAQPPPSASGTPGDSPSPSGSASPGVPPLPKAAEGGTRRVVYSIGAREVWLVDPKKTPEVQAAFPVTGGSVNPTPGSYTVYSRSATASGTDGRQIEHVVRFTQQGGVVFGFSAALDEAAPSPDPKGKTGGIRTDRGDGQTLWDFAPMGTRVQVVG